LVRDVRTTPFNIGRRIELNDFTAIEAAPLAVGLKRLPSAGDAETRRKPGEEGSGPFSPSQDHKGEQDHRREAERLLQRIFFWTGGHPYLTQRLCEAVAEALILQNRKGISVYLPLVDRICEELFLSANARERDDNIIFVRE